eukprot:TRINITY_DN2044_c1_g1_i4.p1 TRINITY_DN2044_c1_g1~~TRINITY_DN2044_c1_g1_i4.p1  ORF type:complete len:473 (+),score=58.54 TRINITY_DN2044_c1_g1_i4:41-1459(+)
MIVVNLGSQKLTVEKIDSFEDYSLDKVYGIKPQTYFSTLENLVKATSLNLCHNLLEYIPNTVLNVNILTNLQLSNNMISEIDHRISNLVSLECLDLSYNLIEYIPPCIGELKNLQHFYLQVNQIRSLPPEIGLLQNLSTLFLQENQLKRLPNELFQLKSLKSLLVSDNDLERLSSHVADLTSLWWLDVRNNNLNYLPSSLYELSNKSLDTLSWEGNEFGNIPFQFKVSLNKTLDYCSGKPETYKVTVDPTSLQDDLAYLLDNNDYYDLEIVVDNTTVYAHKCIIWARKHLFKPVLAKYFENLEDTDTIWINESITFAEFKNILQLLYTGKPYFSNTFINLPRIEPSDKYIKQEYFDLLCYDLKRIVNNQKFSDITFIVDNQLIYAHKVIVCTRSSIFNGMFRCGMRESLEDESRISDTEFQPFFSMLQFLYTGECELDSQNAYDILTLSDLYQVNRLKQWFVIFQFMLILTL